MKSFEYKKGTRPLLISMPHNASLIPESTLKTMTKEAQLSKDTDWFLDRLYDFAEELGVHTLIPRWSRYYIDLNRDPSGEALYPGASNTELCPTSNFNDKPIYLPELEPHQEEVMNRTKLGWMPYHKQIEKVLSDIIAEHGYAILFDAHSICSKVPRFFEGTLPDFNLGNGGGVSCDKTLLSAVENIDYLSWTKVSNGRFKGGYITRQYGNPSMNIHSLQLELSQATYMNEEQLSWDTVKADKIKVQLQKIIQSLLDWRPT